MSTSNKRTAAMKTSQAVLLSLTSVQIPFPFREMDQLLAETDVELTRYRKFRVSALTSRSIGAADARRKRNVSLTSPSAAISKI